MTYKSITFENALSLSNQYQIILSDEEVTEISEAALTATSNGRNYPQILESFIIGFVAEHAAAIALNGQRNQKEFNFSDPNSFYYDLIDDDGMKYEIKTLSLSPKRNFISWKNHNYKIFMKYYRDIDFIIHSSVEEISDNEFNVIFLAINDATLFVDYSADSSVSGVSYFNHHLCKSFKSSSILLRDLKTGK